MDGTYKAPIRPFGTQIASNVYGGSVSQDTDWWGAVASNLANRVGSNLFGNGLDREEQEARIRALDAQTRNASGEDKVRMRDASQRWDAQTQIDQLFDMVRSTPPGTEQDALLREGALRLAEGTLYGNGESMSPEQMRAVGAFFSPAVDASPEARRNFNYGVALSTDTPNENSVFSAQEGADRFAAADATDRYGFDQRTRADIATASIAAQADRDVASISAAAGGGADSEIDYDNMNDGRRHAANLVLQYVGVDASDDRGRRRRAELMTDPRFAEAITQILQAPSLAEANRIAAAAAQQLRAGPVSRAPQPRAPRTVRDHLARSPAAGGGTPPAAGMSGYTVQEDGSVTDANGVVVRPPGTVRR